MTGLIGFIVCIVNPISHGAYDLHFFGPTEMEEADREFRTMCNEADAEGMRVQMFTVSFQAAMIQDPQAPSTRRTMSLKIIETLRDEPGPIATEPEDTDHARLLS